MSQIKPKSFYKDYSRSGYIKKINPEFEGMAKKYYEAKHEHQKYNSLKKHIDQQVAYTERLDQKIQKHLKFKSKELDYVKSVKNRFIDDLKRKQWLNEHKKKEQQKNKQKAEAIKLENQRKLSESHQDLIFKNRILANINRSQNRSLKQLKNIKHAKQWDMKRSRVQQIYQFKQECKRSCDKFYQRKNKSSLNSYKSLIAREEREKKRDQVKIKDLEEKLLKLNSDINKRKEEATETNKEIEKIKKDIRLENQNRSRARSRSSSFEKSLSNSHLKIQSPRK